MILMITLIAIAMYAILLNNCMHLHHVHTILLIHDLACCTNKAEYRILILKL